MRASLCEFFSEYIIYTSFFYTSFLCELRVFLCEFFYTSFLCEFFLCEFFYAFF